MKIQTHHPLRYQIYNQLWELFYNHFGNTTCNHPDYEIHIKISERFFNQFNSRLLRNRLLDRFYDRLKELNK